MARRKHRRTRRRRRVGASSGMKGALMNVAGIAAGVFAGRLVTTKLATTLSPKISALVLIAAGVYLPKFVKSDLGKGLGDGLIATGALAGLQSFGVVSGIGALPPGQAATTVTHNTFTPGMKNMRVVGAAPQNRGQISTAVNGLGRINVNKLGALMEEN